MGLGIRQPIFFPQSFLIGICETHMLDVRNEVDPFVSTRGSGVYGFL